MSFTVRKFSGKISVHTYISMIKGGGHGGSLGEVELDILTSEGVERLITEVLKSMFESRWESIKLKDVFKPHWLSI